MTASPLLTIVTISRNDPEGLRRTLESAERLRETGTVEHLVVDGSDVASEAPRIPPRVRYERRAARGVSDAFNAGLAEARGEWIWFLNGGDVAHPDLEADVLLGILRLTRAGTVAFNMDLASGRRYPRPPLSKLWPPGENWIAHPGVVMRASLLRALGGFSSEYAIAGDFDLLIGAVGGATTTDLIDMPIAVFAEGGLSSNGVLTSRESLRVLLSHATRLLTQATFNLARLPFQLLVLANRGRPGRRPTPSAPAASPRGDAR